MSSTPQMMILGDLVEIRGGGTPDTRIERYWDGEIPWVSPKDMKSDEISTSQDLITLEAIANSATSLVPVGSLLVVVRSGILARTVPVGRTTKPVSINQDIKAIVPGKRISPRYLQYFMKLSEPELLTKVTKGATVHRLGTDELRRLQIPIYELSEQDRIVAVLEGGLADVAAAEAATRAKLQALNELRKSFLVQAFAGALTKDSHAA
jgi:type I restriction enzyme S subunit